VGQQIAGDRASGADGPESPVSMTRHEAHMYIRRIKGPHSVTLPDGTIMTRADLPARDPRWVASRKAAVVRAVDHGLITEAEARETWDLSGEELAAWREAGAPRRGRARATALQRYRDPGRGERICNFFLFAEIVDSWSFRNSLRVTSELTISPRLRIDTS
jgi:hypothetical protein